MDILMEELQCPVCLELFQQPTVLPCSHVLCRSPCAERLFEAGFVRCPVCRDRSFVMGGVQNLPRVLSLENIIETCKNQEAARTPEPSDEDQCQEGDIACQLCDTTPRKARKSCLDCNASYCQPCLNISHPGREPFSRHQLVEPRRYPKPLEPRCPEHDMRVNIYCAMCEQLGCLLCADDKDSHFGHRIMSLEQAAASLRGSVQDGLSKLEQNRDRVDDVIAALQNRRVALQSKVADRRAQILDQCQGLMREVEIKQEFFLSDLEHEERLKTDLVDQHLEEAGVTSVGLQSLQHFTQEVMKESDTCAFIQLAKKATDKLDKSFVACEALSVNSPNTTLSTKVVDVRKERALLRGMEYLSAPNKPTIAVTKCSRSTTKVVLLLTSSSDNDIVDGYQVFYCSEAEKRLGDQRTAVYSTPQQGRCSLRQATSDPAATCLMVENLTPGTMYYFCVQGFNEAGASENSAIINCQTLTTVPTIQPVPEIISGQCRSYTFSVQIYSESAMSSNGNKEITYFLLYRESAPQKLWKSARLQARPNHTVVGLEADMPYEFSVLACNTEGGCTMSETVALRTERDS